MVDYKRRGGGGDFLPGGGVWLADWGFGLSLRSRWSISVPPVRGGTHFLCRRKESKQRKRAHTASREAAPPAWRRQWSIWNPGRRALHVRDKAIIPPARRCARRMGPPKPMVWERPGGARSAAGRMTAVPRTWSARGPGFQMGRYRRCARAPLMSWRCEPAFFAYFLCGGVWNWDIGNRCIGTWVTLRKRFFRSWPCHGTREIP